MKQPVNNIHIKTNDNLEKIQGKVANILGDYFSTMIDQIGGAEVNNLTEQDLSNHLSLKNIIKANQKQPKQFLFSTVRQNVS